MEQTKLSLSPQEFAIAADAGLILTKNAVLQKVKAALEALHTRAIGFVKDGHQLPPGSFDISGKISKGENYNGLPYVVLDYPRNFKQDNIFAIRSMFWWGKQISGTLHLSGEWKRLFTPVLSSRLQQLQNNHLYLSYSGDEWDHDLLGDHYRPLESVTPGQLKQVLTEHSFLKIAAFVPISALKEAPEFWSRTFGAFIEMLTP